jgi:LPS-assembly protein
MPHPFRNVVVTVLLHAPFPLLSRKPFTSSLVLACSLCACSAVLAQPASLPEAAEIDWVSWDSLSPEQQAQLPDGCCGAYVEPPAVAGDPTQLVVSSTAASMTAEGLSELTGNLQVVQGNAHISADGGLYDHSAQLFTLSGNVQLRQPGMLLVGNSAAVNAGNGSSELHAASYLLHDSGTRGTASVIAYTDANGIITIDNGVFTRCEPGDNAWLVNGKSIELNRQTGMGTARAVTLRVNDVPMLYLPWVRFPITDQRASGLLAPIIGSTRDGGLDIATPYYLNLAPNYDATLTPRIQLERGVMLGLETRYLGQRWQQTANLQYLPDDQLFDQSTALLPGSDSPPQSNRWALDYNLAANLGRGWGAGINYRSVSDQDYFQDFGNNGLNSTTQSYLYRTANLYYRNRHWNFLASTQDVQIIDPSVSSYFEPYRTLPRLTLDGYYYLPSGFEFGLATEYVQFDRDLNAARFTQAEIDSGVLVTGSRFAVTPQLSLPLTNTYGFFTPTVKYKYAAWSLDRQARGGRQSPSRGIFSANLDSGLIFERDTTIAGTQFRQTLEPRLYYLYNEYADQSDIPLFDTSELTFSFNQLFRDDRYSGKDRVGDANQLTLAVSSRFYDDKGQEKAHLSVGQIRHFKDRRVTSQALPGLPEQLSQSALTSEYSYQIAEHWRTGAYVEWNHQANKLDVGNMQLQYQLDDNRILNLAYRYRDVPAPLFVNGFNRRIRQADVSTVWPLAANWNLVARWNYDYSNARTLEALGGVEYSTCCWRVRVIARSWIDNDALYFGRADNNNGVFVQFELKGLGSILGGNVSSILNNGITGYQDRNNGRF